MVIPSGKHHPDEEDPLLSWRSGSSSARGARKKAAWWEWLWLLLTAFMVVVWVVVGVVVGMDSEGWSWLTSLYVITQIITTVGYGDITVQTETMKIFMTFYVMGCLIFLSYVVNKFAERMLQKNANFFMEKVEVLQVKLSARSNPGSAREEDAAAPPKPALQTWLGQLGPFYHSLLNVFIASGGFLFWVGLGTVFFATYEKCSCSYGRTLVAGCIEGEQCPQTGGYVKTWVDAYYMSVITLTSVGFGDHTPRSWYGRLFGIVWMVFGVITTASFVGNCADLFFEASSVQRDEDQIEFSKEVFMQMDTKQKGYVTRDEFLEFLLLKYKLVEKHDLITIGKLYSDVDVDGDGKVDIDEVDRRFGVNEPNTGLADKP